MPDDLMALAELAARVEWLSGPDREVDADIAVAIRWSPAGIDESLFFSEEIRPLYAYKVPKFTASLDAAMTLVPDDYDWAVFRTNGGLTVHAWCGSREDVFGDTPALALTAAALRARASQSGVA
ncbi:hypothetical protein [Sphingomonas montanisoli]|uniref:DUF2591 domain-containing protein n=1 Tax=Sphingomonas montanisoli TaxID=2606412 RepID=A0A5D9C1A3_9SPHN|nr:hypothetical protein [Sphingomonas montanisoli]TZG25628.1 hypothetical protein FYJ91_11420 [Sphingomonas montanisoli]